MTPTVIAKILAANKCGDLFTNDPVTAKQEYRDYAKVIHPDLCADGRADKAMGALNRLYARACECFRNSTWEASNIAYLKTSLGKTNAVYYVYQDHFEHGIRYVCRESVAYVFSPGAKKYFENAVRKIASLKYADAKMKAEMGKFVPSATRCIECDDGSCAIVLRKPDGFVPMDIFYKKMAQNLDGCHVAWIMSRLNNIACFLHYNQLSHNGITLANCFVSAKDHSVMLLGGWEYATNYDEKMIGVTKDVYSLMTTVDKTEKLGSPVTDLESVKAIGRMFEKKTTIPDALSAWMNKGSSASAYKEF